MSDETEKSVAIRQEHAVASPGALLSAMLELARDPSFDVAKFEALANLQLKMEDRQAERDLTRDLQAIQRAIPPVEKNGRIPKGKDSIPFAKFEDIMAHLQPLLNERGMSVSFSTRFENLKIVVSGILRHPAGSTMSVDVPLPIDEGPGRNTTQAHVSSITYGKRTALRELFNIIDKGADDDGHTAHLKLMDGEQVAALTELVTDGGITAQEVLGHFFPAERWVSFEEVPASEFSRLKKAIESRNRKKGEKGNE
jgi:hypothetical protein